MPDIIIKDKDGTDIVYSNLDTISFRQDGGGIATYYTPDAVEPTEEWEKFEEALKDTSLSRVIATLDTGRLVSTYYHGTWWQNGYDAKKISNTYFQYVNPLDVGVLCRQSSGNEWYFFDADSQEFTLLDLNIPSDQTNNTAVQKLYGKFIIPTYNCIVIFNPQTKLFNVVYQIPSGYSSGGVYGLNVGNNKVLISFRDSSPCPGIFCLDLESETFTQIYSTGYGYFGNWLTSYLSYEPPYWYFEAGYSVYDDVNDGFIIFDRSSSNGGTLFYDCTQNSISQIFNNYRIMPQSGSGAPYNYYQYNSGGVVKYIYIVENKGIIFKSTSAASLVFYRYADKTIEEVISTTYCANTYEEEDVVVCTNSISSVVYDKINDVWYSFPSVPSVYTAAILDIGIVLGTEGSVKFYDFQTETITNIYTGNNWMNSAACSAGVLLISDNSNQVTVWFFDKNLQTLTQIYSAGTSICRFFKHNDNIIVITSSGYLFFSQGVGVFTSIPANCQIEVYFSIKVRDGVVTSPNSTSNRKSIFIDGTTGTYTELDYSGYFLGPYRSTYYGITNYMPKDSYIYESGDYAILKPGSTSTSGYAIVFNQVTHQAVARFPSTAWPTIIEFENIILSIPAASTYGYIINKNDWSVTNTQVIYINKNLYAWPLCGEYHQIPVSNGYLYYFPRCIIQTTAYNSKEGIFYLDITNNTCMQVWTREYFNKHDLSNYRIYNDECEMFMNVRWDDTTKQIIDLSE